jgi:hypothetical protein
MEESKIKRPEIFNISINFSQRGNTMGTTDGYEDLNLKLEFPAGEKDGAFYVLKTESGWSIDDKEDIQKLIDVASEPLKKIKEIYPEDELPRH